jgi:hypothetical protein
VKPRESRKKRKQVERVADNKRYYESTLVPVNKNYHKSEDEFSSSGISTFEDLLVKPGTRPKKTRKNNEQ